jgi:glycosyltransferase involved in cell wall biosynthesis
MKWYHLLAERVLKNITDRITVNAKIIASYLVEKEGVNPGKIVTIYNGIDLKRFEDRGLKIEDRKNLREKLGIKTDSLVVGMVGRFSEQKDYDTFIKSAQIVCGQMGNVVFVAVGDGVLKSSLELQAAGYGLKDKVIFTGHRADTDELIRVFDVGVLSSHYEGCPNVILEYMACSKPLVASDVGGCRELVVDGETGYIVPHKSPEVLAVKLLALLRDEALRLKMGDAGRKRVEENFTSEKMATETEKLFLELLENRK